MAVGRLNKFVFDNADLVVSAIKEESKLGWGKIGLGGKYVEIKQSTNWYCFYDEVKKEVFKSLGLKNIFSAEHCLDYITYFGKNTSFPMHVDSKFTNYEHKRINYVLSKPDDDIFLFSDSEKLALENHCFYKVDADEQHGLSENNSDTPLILLVFSYIKQKDNYV